jgi:hypothetical protein
LVRAVSIWVKLDCSAEAIFCPFGTLGVPADFNLETTVLVSDTAALKKLWIAALPCVTLLIDATLSAPLRVAMSFAHPPTAVQIVLTYEVALTPEDEDEEPPQPERINVASTPTVAIVRRIARNVSHPKVGAT